MREWLVFDVMGVIFTVGDDTNELLVPYVQKVAPSLTCDEINQAYLEASLGKVASCDFWKTLGLGEAYPQIEQDYLEHQLTLDADFPAVAQKLQKEYHLALLSNDISEWSAYLREKYDLNQYFEEIVISGDVGLRKPDKAIYELLLRRLQCRPENSVFIDDRQKNLIPAMRAGMKTIQFKRGCDDSEMCGSFEVKSFKQLPGLVAHLFGV
nr:HAD-IA family hydrolase [uncultured Anaeromusa sp.]